MTGSTQAASGRLCACHHSTHTPITTVHCMSVYCASVPVIKLTFLSPVCVCVYYTCNLADRVCILYLSSSWLSSRQEAHVSNSSYLCRAIVLMMYELMSGMTSLLARQQTRLCLSRRTSSLRCVLTAPFFTAEWSAARKMIFSAFENDTRHSVQLPAGLSYSMLHAYNSWYIVLYITHIHPAGISYSTLHTYTQLVYCTL